MTELRYEDVLELLSLDRGVGPDRFTPARGDRDAFLARTLELAALAPLEAPRVGHVSAPASKPWSTGARVGIAAAVAAALLLALGAVALFWFHSGDDGEPETRQPVAQPQPPEEQLIPPEQLESPAPIVDEDDVLATPIDKLKSDDLDDEIAAEVDKKLSTGGGQEAVAPPKASVDTGNLNVNSKPWSYVYVDGKKVGSTPIAGLKLKPGSHVVKLKVASTEVVRTYKVMIKAGKTTTLVKDLENEKLPVKGEPKQESRSGPPGKLTVQTKPWSTVFINGRKIKNTPLVNYSLKPGTYSVTVENPTYSIKKTYRVKIKPGQTTTLVKTLL